MATRRVEPLRRAAAADPIGADALASGSAGDDGRVDFTSDAPLSAAIAIIALVETPTAFLTETPVAATLGGESLATGSTSTPNAVVFTSILTEP